MNLTLNAMDLVRWLHVIALSAGFGGALVTLLLSGFEEGREDIQGLAATVWAQVVRWGFRLAVVAGAALFVLHLRAGHNPFSDGYYFHLKLTLVLVLLGLSETAPKALAAGRRGSALLVVVCFLAATFVVFNNGLFAVKPKPVIPAVHSAN